MCCKGESKIWFSPVSQQRNAHFFMRAAGKKFFSMLRDRALRVSEVADLGYFFLRQKKFLQRSIKYMINDKRRSSSAASSTCSTAREDPPA